jgi:hypothetical protein
MIMAWFLMHHAILTFGEGLDTIYGGVSKKGKL